MVNNVSDIAVGEVLIDLMPESPLKGPHRVLEINKRLNQVTLIPVPVIPRKSDAAKQKNYYARGFKLHRLSYVSDMLSAHLIGKTLIEPPPLWHLADADLEKLGKRGIGANESVEGKWLSSELKKREFKWKLIEPLVPEAYGGSGIKPPDLTCLDRLVHARASEMGVSQGQVFDALHRYFAFSCGKNGLLPNTLGHCGAPGKYRIAKNNIKLGRPNALVKNGDQSRAGLILTEEHIQNIQDGYSMYVRPGTTVPQAFRQMTAAFYRIGHKKEHGHLVPILLPAHERPTLQTFRTHGPRAEGVTHAARRIMGKGEWARNWRPLISTAQSGIVTMGQVGSLDASPIDVNLVACYDPLQPIGVGRGLFVRDVFSGLYVGWTISMGGMGTEDAKLAILRAASDKTALLARYGVDLPAEEFPSIFFSKYLSDNGELRSSDGIDSIAKKLSSRIIFVPSGRAELNSSSESGHHTRHRRFDHPIEGSNKGRQTKRGETPPRSKALLSRFEYTRLLILWIHWANTQQELPLSDIPGEMIRDYSLSGKALRPTRLELFQWGLANGIVSGIPMAQNYLKAHLLPRFKASIQRQGLILHRPDTGDRVELLSGARFNSDYLSRSPLILDCLRSKENHIEVMADPDNLSHIYISDAKGIHEIPNIKANPLIASEGSVIDLCAMKEAQKIHNLDAATRTDQDLAAQDAYREETQADAKARKDAAKATAKTASQKTGQLPIREAQAQDNQQHLDHSVQFANQPSRQQETVSSIEQLQELSSPQKQSESALPPEQPAPTPPPNTSVTQLNDHRLMRLLRFKSERRNP
ncbi:hypothetical protein SAMN05216319_3337 [Duganella sp. CF402]|uniref:hypothetical protein n=1 Tax=unclassified Duganella TaxID=2636909 RepID=UPI0008B4CC93|nr:MULTISPECIES: hypothetical protein [unclassified Duganella]RZT08249.1 hypothetical protein EV582_0281 [Duganella sp. BK701]SEM00718.1 hypothetical protein SAMN05216319_3337 [Duganella sp. CF402]